MKLSGNTEGMVKGTTMECSGMPFGEVVDAVRVALGVIDIGKERAQNLGSMLAMAESAAAKGADLLLFPEASLTGLINRDEPAEDLPLGVSVPGPITDRLSQKARELGVHLALGLLERDGDRLFDTALLFDPCGELVLRYRRISSGWHGLAADPEVYGHGDAVRAVDTQLGRVAFLICGDLFSDEASTAGGMSFDWLLVPYARCSDEPGYDQNRWESEEEPHYSARVRELGVTTLMANYLAPGEICRGMCGWCSGGAYGGAMVILGDGTIAAKKPAGEEGMLLADL